MNANFKLRKGKKINTILLDFRYGRSIRIRLSTNLTIQKGSEHYWDGLKCRIKYPNDISDYENINSKLREFEGNIETAIANLESKGKLSQWSSETVIKEIVNKDTNTYHKKNDNSSSKDVLTYFDWYLEFYADRISPNSKKVLTSGTIKTYGNCKSYFEKYMKSRSINKFYFEDVNKEFYYDFIDYGNEKGYSRNYIGSMIQKFKTIIKSAYENGNHKNEEFKRKYFSKLTEEINHPYLNKDELDEIYKVNLKDDYLNNVRDIFLIACNTGLRVGDLTTFLKKPALSKLGDRDCIFLKQQKTGNEVYIPLTVMVQNILKKRKNKFPPYIHPNLLNKDLKRILKRAEITEHFTRHRTIRGQKASDTKPKYKFISMHTARRSFCTNAYNEGMAPHRIMTFSGHKSEKVFMNYIKATVKEKALQAVDHSFFN